MTREAKQRFLSLDVGEVSVVDTPANEVEFIVLKRHTTENNEMPEQTAETAESAAKPAVTPPEVVTVETTKAADASEATIKESLANVASIVENITKMARGEATNVEPPKEPAEEAIEETTKAAKPRDLFMKGLKKAGLKGDDLTKAMKEFDTASAPAAKVTKSDDAEATAAADEDDVLKSLEGLEQAIAKAKKFTPKRQTQMEALVKGLVTLLKELSPTAIPQGSSPASMTAEQALGGSSVPVGVSKQVLEQLVEVSKALTAINERVEAIEQTREAPSALATDETVTETTKKKNMWGGVL